nr:serine/threonine-protein kinase fray2 [Osmia lignaria]XP_034189579.1 serine/threonine-protein kinase fray2 [Osmia lignaria]XP_034189580.1 serine/threonine-protein kinase fray2 [Osmia lignaria]XP_034189581.1 serine/threonine-protein kinase fray2 [Osmia lignaria]
MTTMDSDSESQDSDDGRRFRFEATRKDNLQPETKLGKLSKVKSEHKSCYNDIECKSRKDKSKRDCNRDEHRSSRERDTDNRDIKYSKHAHESRSSRHDDSKDYKNTRDVSLSSRSSVLLTKHKTRDAKRHRNRDRDEHHKNRSHERSRSRNDNDKHKNKSHEKYKHHSYDRNRDRGYQSSKARSEDREKLRGESERYSVCKNSSTKDDEEQCLHEHSSPKSTEPDRNDNELVTKGDSSTDNQECKELNLSEFDILSETDENMSDSSDVKSKSSVLQQHKVKTKKRNLNDEHECILKKQATEIEHSEGLAKVNARMNDSLHGSSNNNSGTISDSALGTISPISMEISQDCRNNAYQKCENESRNDRVDLNRKEDNKNSLENVNNCDSLNATEVTLPSSHPSDGNNSKPSLPLQLITDSSNDLKLVKSKGFIGPCLPENTVTKTSENDSSSDVNQNNGTDLVFGPVLPPHLLKPKCDNEMNVEIISPTLPTIVIQSSDNDEIEQAESESEDAIGPLPIDHPALKTNYVYRQLEQRALEIQKEQKDEGDSTQNQREEWMTELPAVQVSNLGLTSRKFRMKSGPDMSDRSCWTDTPAKKAVKQKQQESETMYNTSTIALVKESYEVDPGESKRQEKSLLEIHQSKVRKKKKKEEKRAKLSGETIRRPFDRDVDLQINRFDQAQKNAVIKKAQCLDDRFSRGKF